MLSSKTCVIRNDFWKERKKHFFRSEKCWKGYMIEFKNLRSFVCDPFFLQCTLFLTIPFLFSLTSYNFSLLLFTRTLTLVVVDSSSFKIEECLHKMAICLKHCRVEQKNHSSLARWHDLPFSGDHFLRLLDILSVDLDTSVSLPQSKTRLQKAFSPNASALSLWHSLPLRGYMVGCGCHDILIPLPLTVLFSTTFLLISISRVEGEGGDEFI